MPRIQAQSISFSYGNKSVFKDLDFSLTPNTLTVIVGPNGSGKSTLLKCCAGILAPSQGKVTLDDKELQSMSRRELASHIAFLPQEVHFAFPFKVYEIVEMGVYHRKLKDNVKTAVQTAMKQAHIEHFADRYFDELSGGEKKRVLIGQALCQQSPFLFLDEPTAALDPKHANDLFESLKTLSQSGTSVVMITHDLTLALRYADRAFGLHQGKNLFDCPPNQMVEKLESMYETPFFHGVLPNQQQWLSQG